MGDSLAGAGFGSQQMGRFGPGGQRLKLLSTKKPKKDSDDWRKWTDNLDMPKALQPSFSNLANKEFPSCNVALASSAFIS